ncbi:MAG: 4-(cytidine 5'-diphospho)-2-C-methyl-D-erythritol kinase [Gemmatimonadetes bacterium]|nr:4-(cytidine 5'-diphospho)-2-C-methyl-D-erythritol kinase [Gemmatimonadota bacterium]
MTAARRVGARIHTPAKINLTLRILARRPSGFHELETVFQAIGLWDTLEVELRDEPRIELAVRGADVGPARDNLVTRAASAFLEAANLRSGFAIVLDKGIPAGAGLGGGSSDAGATLRLLDALHPGRVGPGELHDIAAGLGSDVPFFAAGLGRALGFGRGERLRPLGPLPPAWLVLGLPAVHVATGPAYGSLAKSREAFGGAVPPSLFGNGAAAPTDWAATAAMAVNDFETVVPARYPAVGRALEALRETGAEIALLSGSGAAVFAVFADRGAAESALEAVSPQCPDTRFVVVPTLGRVPGLNEPRPTV